jgi:hypothetical protein
MKDRKDENQKDGKAEKTIDRRGERHSDDW